MATMSSRASQPVRLSEPWKRPVATSHTPFKPEEYGATSHRPLFHQRGGPLGDRTDGGGAQKVAEVAAGTYFPNADVRFDRVGEAAIDGAYG